MTFKSSATSTSPNNRNKRAGQFDHTSSLMADRSIHRIPKVWLCILASHAYARMTLTSTSSESSFPAGVAPQFTICTIAGFQYFAIMGSGRS